MSLSTVYRLIHSALNKACVASGNEDLTLIADASVSQNNSTEEQLEIVIIPNNGQDKIWGTERIYEGLFRIILHFPLDASSTYSRIEKVEKISDYFAKSNTLRGDGFKVKFPQMPKVGGVLRADHERLVSATVEYSASSE